MLVTLTLGLLLHGPTRQRTGQTRKQEQSYIKLVLM
jgi:hypothetical protein